MARTGSTIGGSVGSYRTRVAVEAPGAPVPDPDGGYTEGWAPLVPPDWECAIRQATQRDLESIGAGTVLAQAQYLVEGNYHRGMTTKARLRWTDEGRERVLS